MTTRIGCYEIFSNPQVAGEPSSLSQEEKMEMDLQEQKTELLGQRQETLAKYFQLKQSYSEIMRDLMKELEENQTKQFSVRCNSVSSADLEEREQNILNTMRKMQRFANQLDQDIHSLKGKIAVLEE